MKIFANYDKLFDLFTLDKMYGSQGFCLVKGNLICKIYFEPKFKKYDFTNYKSSYITFPIRYLYDRENTSDGIIGEIMPYYPKEAITWSIDEKIDLEKFIKNYQDIKEEVFKYPEIEMVDLCEPNILYDDSGFSLIDTTKWIIHKNGKFSNQNIRKIDFELFYRIVCQILGITNQVLDNGNFYHNLQKYGKFGNDLFKNVSLGLEDERYELLVILQLLQEIALKSGNERINTLEDAQNYIKTLKNS